MLYPAAMTICAIWLVLLTLTPSSSKPFIVDYNSQATLITLILIPVILVIQKDTRHQVLSAESETLSC